MSFTAIIQARIGSKRLPGKVMMKLSDFDRNSEVIRILINRVSLSKNIKNIIVATSKNKSDAQIVKFCKSEKIKYHKGSEKNVLRRVYEASKKTKDKNLVLLTGDNPLIDYKIIDYMINYLKKNPEVQFLTNSNFFKKDSQRFPDGMIVSILKKNILRLAIKKANKKDELEHPTLFFYTRGKEMLNIKNIKVPVKWLSKYKIRLTLDTFKDYKLIKILYEKLSKKNKYFGLVEINKFINKNSRFLKINKKIKQKLPSILNN